MSETVPKIVLHNYFRSSSSYRVRIALNLKGLPWEYKAVNLLNGEQNAPEFLKISPLGQVPCLVIDGKPLTQSMAMVEYLDQIAGGSPLFPKDPFERAQVVAFCEHINSGIQPLQNLVVLKELEKRYGADQTAKEQWVQKWIERGFEGIERVLQETAGTFCFGNTVGAADAFLIPQIVAAERFKVDVSRFSKIQKIGERSLRMDPFEKAHPKNCPDARPAS